MIGNLLRFGIDLDGENLNVFEGNIYARNVIAPAGRVFYVDKQVTASGNGASWRRAFKTIQEAIDAANDTLVWTDDQWWADNWIVIAPGEYDEALTPPYACHMMGVQRGMQGPGQMAEIHPTEGSPLSGTVSGLHLYNLRLEVTEADKDVLDLGICNDCLIESCALVCGTAAGGAASAFISTTNSDHLRVYDCAFEYGGGGSPHNYGIYAAGGAEKYLHHADIRGNVIQGVRSGGTGIFIQDTCTASNTIIRDNIINIPGAGKGIDDNNGGSLCVNNFITIGGAGDAIEHAGGAGRTIHNHVVVNGTGAIEVTSS